jgi:hypothetical protein
VLFENAGHAVFADETAAAEVAEKGHVDDVRGRVVPLSVLSSTASTLLRETGAAVVEEEEVVLWELEGAARKTGHLCTSAII